MLDNVLKWVLSIIVLAGFFYLGYEIVSGQVKTSDPNMLLLIGTVFGAASTYTGSVISYHFGSTKSSVDKDATLRTMAANLPVTPSTQTTTTTTASVEPPITTTIKTEGKAP